MLILNIILTLFAVVFAADYFRAFFRSNAGAITGGLCRPCFGLFYPHLKMLQGFLVWLLEFAVILAGAAIWFI
jgi:hypothetical protein